MRTIGAYNQMHDNSLAPSPTWHDAEINSVKTFHTDPSNNVEHLKAEEIKFHDFEGQNPPGRSRPSRMPWYRKAYAWWKYAVEHRSWKFGLFVGLYTSLGVLIGNIILVLVGTFSHGGIKDGIGTLAVGDGSYISRLGASYHILINIVSTVLLISSNYAMQILCAPTRQEIDIAHQKGSWMDIGLMSIHNLWHIRRRRVLLWSLLAFSSIPLHLFYNSAIFHVTAGQDYSITVINASAPEIQNPQLKRLENKHWRSIYDAAFVPGFSNLFLVTSEASLAVKIEQNWTVSYHWPNEMSCNWESWDRKSSFSIELSQKMENGVLSVQTSGTNRRVFFNIADPLFQATSPEDAWPKFGTGLVNVTVNGTGTSIVAFCDQSSYLLNYPYKIDYALAEPLEKSSKVQFALSFMVVIIVANAFKVVSIYMTLRMCSSGHCLTMGDAISSYLEQPEESTLGQCTLGRNKATNQCTDPESKPWKYDKKHMVTILRGNLKLCGWTLAFAALINILLLGPATKSLNSSTGDFHHWGTASKLLLPFASSSFTPKAVLFNAWLANTPQVILSLAYFSINRLVTSIHFSKEWNSYARIRKGLRVTEPVGSQRPTHFLQIPYRWAIPLSVISGILHWMLSQALFLVRFEVRDTNGNLYPDSTCACGYSPLSVFIFTLTFLGLLLCVVCLLLQKFDLHMPVAGHCSTVISAACHPPPEDQNTHLKKVQWGVVRNRFGGSIEHCTFTSEETMPPQEGELYA